MGLSVSRVGGNAQIKAMKSIAGMLRLDLAQFRELEAFAKFGSDLDKATQQQLTRGYRMVEILKQKQYVPMLVENQVAIIYAGTSGYLDDIELDQVSEFEKGLLDFMDANYRELLDEIKTVGEMSDDAEKKMKKAIEDFKKGFSAS